MTYGSLKDLSRRTASDKILHDKTFNISKNLKYDGYERGLCWFISFSMRNLVVLILIMWWY